MSTISKKISVTLRKKGIDNEAYVTKDRDEIKIVVRHMNFILQSGLRKKIEDRVRSSLQKEGVKFELSVLREATSIRLDRYGDMLVNNAVNSDAGAPNERRDESNAQDRRKSSVWTLFSHRRSSEGSQDC